MTWIGRTKNFLRELKRRNVFRVGSIYLITAWGASLGVSELFPAFGAPDWTVRAFVITVALGFPLALVLAWAFEITPDGVVLDPGNPDTQAPPEPAADNISTNTTMYDAPSVQAHWHSGDREQDKKFYKAFTIGRDDAAELQVVDIKISRKHARVAYIANRWVIEDLDSRNGTILNGTLVRSATPLNEFNEVLLYEGATPIRLMVDITNEPTRLDASDGRSE